MLQWASRLKNILLINLVKSGSSYILDVEMACHWKTFMNNLYIEKMSRNEFYERGQVCLPDSSLIIISSRSHRNISYFSFHKKFICQMFEVPVTCTYYQDPMFALLRNVRQIIASCKVCHNIIFTRIVTVCRCGDHKGK